MSKTKVVLNPESLVKEGKKSFGEGRLSEAVEFAKKACDVATSRKDAVLNEAKELALSCVEKDPRLQAEVAKFLTERLGLDPEEAYLLIEARIRRPGTKKEETKRFEGERLE